MNMKKKRFVTRFACVILFAAIIATGIALAIAAFNPQPVIIPNRDFAPAFVMPAD